MNFIKQILITILFFLNCVTSMIDFIQYCLFPLLTKDQLKFFLIHYCFFSWLNVRFYQFYYFVLFVITIWLYSQSYQCYERKFICSSQNYWSMKKAHFLMFLFILIFFLTTGFNPRHVCFFFSLSKSLTPILSLFNAYILL